MHTTDISLMLASRNWAVCLPYNVCLGEQTIVKFSSSESYDEFVADLDRHNIDAETYVDELSVILPVNYHAIHFR